MKHFLDAWLEDLEVTEVAVENDVGSSSFKTKLLKQLNYGVSDVVDAISSSFTPEQLDLLEIKGTSRNLAFKDRLLIRFMNLYPRFSVEESRNRAKWIIDLNSAFFALNDHLEMKDIFLSKFDVLFDDEKDGVNKRKKHLNKNIKISLRI